MQRGCVQGARASSCTGFKHGQCRLLPQQGPRWRNAKQQGTQRQHAQAQALLEAGSLLPKSCRRSGIQGALSFRGSGGTQRVCADVLLREQGSAMLVQTLQGWPLCSAAARLQLPSTITTLLTLPCSKQAGSKRAAEWGRADSVRCRQFLAPICSPPSVNFSVVGCYQNILACGGSSLTSAHQNVGTALSLKAKPA